MMLDIRTEQKLRFYFYFLTGLIGTSVYFYYNGSLLQACLFYLLFGFMHRSMSVAYHRWLAHRHIIPGSILKFYLLWIIVASGLTRPVPYVIGHRIHHKHSDTDNDPHHTRLGLLKTIMGDFVVTENIKVPVKDILSDKWIMFVNNNYNKLYLANLGLFYFISLDLFLLAFGLLNLRCLVGANLFNYFAHGGKKTQKPVNMSAWVNLIQFGEQLHKNHHDNPSLPYFGRESKYNFDFVYFVLRTITTVRYPESQTHL